MGRGGMLGGLWRGSSDPPSAGRPKPSENKHPPGDQSAVSAHSESKDGTQEAPPVPPRPSEEELRSTITHRLIMNPPTDHQNQDHTDGIKKEREDEEKMKSREEHDTTTAELQRIMKSSDPGRVHVPLKDESDERSVNKNQTDEEKMPKKPKVKKKKNPFMPHVVNKGHMVQKKRGEMEPVEKKSLVEQLNELRLDRDQHEDLESLMEWWSTVEQWEPTPKDEDMTEKEEAKAFAVTAERVQRGVRVFNQLYSERAEALWQHVIDLYAIADALDRFSWRTKVAQITGGSTSAVGGVTTIAGLALAPVTMGTSLIVTAVGLGVATAGGLTSASAGISSAVNDSLDRKKVERIVQDFQSKMADIDKCTRFIKRGVENLRQLNAPRVTKMKVSDNDFPKLTSVYEDGAMAGKAVLTNAKEIARVTQVAMVTGGTAARAAQVASMATGVLSGLFVAMDVYFVAKDSRELRKGAKSEFARKIREVTEQLQQGLVELNGIRDELQLSGISSSTNTSSNTSSTTSNTSAINSTNSSSNISSNTSNTSAINSTNTSSNISSNISNTSSNSSNTSAINSTNSSSNTSSNISNPSSTTSNTSAINSTNTSSNTSSTTSNTFAINSTNSSSNISSNTSANTSAINSTNTSSNTSSNISSNTSSNISSNTSNTSSNTSNTSSNISSNTSNTSSNISTTDTSNTSTTISTNISTTSNTSAINSTNSSSNTSSNISITDTSTVTSSSCTFTTADVPSTPAVPADTSSSSGTEAVPVTPS